jgi:hypothetical protein
VTLFNHNYICLSMAIKVRNNCFFSICLLHFCTKVQQGHLFSHHCLTCTSFFSCRQFSEQQITCFLVRQEGPGKSRKVVWKPLKAITKGPTVALTSHKLSLQSQNCVTFLFNRKAMTTSTNTLGQKSKLF